jgi:hypothetical protein
MYRAPNGRLFQDGGLKNNNPIGLAVAEARDAWTDCHEVDIAVSIGTGWSDSRVAYKNEIYSRFRHGWLKRCIDTFENNLDSAKLWRDYKRSLNKELGERHHRLDVKFSRTLPTLDSTDEIEVLDTETKEYFEHDEARAQLRQTAEALLSSLFYPVVGEISKVSEGYFAVECRILCRLEQKHQTALLERLKNSGCVFHIHRQIFPIGFEKQRNSLENGCPFELNVHWNLSSLTDKVHLLLAFGITDLDGQRSQEDPQPELERQYHISASPHQNL